MKKLLLLIFAPIAFTGCKDVELSNCELDLYVTGVENIRSKTSESIFRRSADEYGWDVIIKSGDDYKQRDTERSSILIALDNTEHYHFDKEFKYASREYENLWSYSDPMLQFEKICNNKFTLNIPEANKKISKNFKTDQHVVFSKADNPTKEQIVKAFEGYCGWFKVDDFYHWASIIDIPNCKIK